MPITAAIHGTPDARRRSPLMEVVAQLAMGGVVLMAAGIVGFLLWSGWARGATERSDWTIAGPACPVVAAASPLVVGKKPAKVFSYGGAEFSRAFGHASCNGWRENGPSDVRWVCQFSGPGAVTVTTAGRSVVFQPGVGRRATVTVRQGRPSCVVAGWFAA
jgi:hypothetical protein